MGTLSLKIGILGAGQLARMSAESAKALGHKVHIFSDRDDKEPACEFADSITTGVFSDIEKLKVFANDCDLITLENEFIETQVLKSIEEVIPIYPSSKSFGLIADKITEKESFQNAGIEVTPFQAISNFSQLKAYAQLHKYPLMLKASKGGYDGYGNFTVKSEDELAEGFKKLGGEQGNSLLVEKFINLKKEVAIQVVRSRNETILYPICETTQENHICVEVFSPAQIEKTIEAKIKDYALKAVESIDGIGIFAFEFFIGDNDEVFLNESAPRPHNSGHYTIEGCETSQFENHIRAITGMPLGSTKLNYPITLMLNILGTQNGPSDYECIYETPENVYIHLYGKHTSRIGRKMGHLTVTGDNLEMIRQQANVLLKGISI